MVHFIIKEAIIAYVNKQTIAIVMSGREALSPTPTLFLIAKQLITETSLYTSA